MKVLVSPDFNTKVSSLNSDALRSLSVFVSGAEQSSKNEFLSHNNHKLSLLGDDIYIAKIDSSRVYFTLGEDDQGSFLLLLDISTIQNIPSTGGGGFFTTKNPKTNSALNPSLNSSINPRLNSSINPKLNSSINPKLNSSINPRLNSSINPRLNSSINPRLNSSINPRLNSSINPRLNSSLNPRLNRSYGGPYLYDVNLNQEAYIVRASNVDLLFNLNGEFIKLLVSANDLVKIEFDQNNEWTGFYVKANEDVWLRFLANNSWAGILV